MSVRPPRPIGLWRWRRTSQLSRAPTGGALASAEQALGNLVDNALRQGLGTIRLSGGYAHVANRDGSGADVWISIPKR